VREFNLWQNAAELQRLNALLDSLDTMRKAYHANASSYQEAIMSLRSDIRRLEIGRQAAIDETWEDLRGGK